MKMFFSSKITVLFVTVLSVLIAGCNKLSQEEKNTIERYKKSYRDPRIIGKWLSFEEKENFIFHYRPDGEVEYAYPVYSEKKEIEGYEISGKSEIYYYTKNDSIVLFYIVNRSWAYGSTESMGIYKIKNDTIFYRGEGGCNAIKVNLELKR